jgi:YidC/Oxa1 family membrane protein insertase
MKLRMLFLSLAVAFSLWTLRPAGAQGLPLPASPAYGVAQRLTAEAKAASDTHNDRDTHDRAMQAAAKYRDVISSREFGSTAWGSEAAYQLALIQRDYLKDDNAAVQTLQQQLNSHSTVDFPDKANAKVLLTTMEAQVDNHNRTTYPGSILYGVMNFFVNLFGGRHFSYSYALAILFISVLVRLILTPVSNKQFASMREMQKLQPAIKELQGKYKNDKALLGTKTMELYKANNINPAAGCLPMLFQLPLLYLLYYMIRLYQFQFVHGHFLWVGSPLAKLIPGGIVAPNLGEQDIPLLVLYALSMYVTQKLTITPSLDPQQAEQQRQMAVMTPFISAIFFLQWHLPSAFVLYYLIFNILSTAQQKYYMHKHHADIHGETEIDKPDSKDDGPKTLLVARNGSNGSSNGAKLNGNGTKPYRNGSTPSAKGVISPSKIHPKKKRR